MHFVIYRPTQLAAPYFAQSPQDLRSPSDLHILPDFRKYKYMRAIARKRGQSEHRSLRSPSVPFKTLTDKVLFPNFGPQLTAWDTRLLLSGFQPLS